MVEPILTYYDLGPDVTAFSTTRHGGYSKGHYGSFNINRYCGDDATNVERNTELLCRKLCIKPRDLIMPHQEHTTEVKLVNETLLEKDDVGRAAFLEATDGLLTSERGVCIGVSTADCLPVLLFDPVGRAVGAVHSGWRGTKGRIVAVAVGKMKDCFGTRPADLLCVVGPGIDMDSFEVGNEVYEAFDEAGFPMEEIARIMGAKWHIDLPLAVTLTLESAGVKKENIICPGISSYQNVRDYFSARRLTIRSGRTFTGIILR